MTTAWFLRRYGCEVTVLDRTDGPGRETSFANGSILTPSMADPWNAPGCWRALLRSIGRNSAMQLRLRALPSLAGWGVQFLRNATPERFASSTLANLRLARYSLEVLARLRDETEIQYWHSARGTLRIFRDEASLAKALNWAKELSREGVAYRALSAELTVELEPALKRIAGQLAGGIHYDGDESGDAHKFCVGLAECAKRAGVEFRFNHEVRSIESTADRVTGVTAGVEHFVADRYVVAAGSYSPLLLARLGVQMPVQPVKGYSLTLYGYPPGATSLSIPVVDDALHAVIVPLERAIRVAGTAEFAGYDRSVPAPRIRNLLQLISNVLPGEVFDPSAAKAWSGLRPMSVDGVPIIGPTPIDNCFVNTGHGHLGWTMAAGSGKALADLMCGNSASFDTAPYALARFAKR